MKLKDTLNLGKTEFPMRAGLPTKEPVWQKEWEDAKLYQRRQELNQGKPHFTLHDGPPYANGNIHVGHAMNKISKDIIVRSKSMSGFYAPFKNTFKGFPTSTLRWRHRIGNPLHV